MFDQDGSGNISKEELGNVMKALGQNMSLEELTEMINEADLDGDGEVSFEEFVRMMDK